MPRSVLVLVLVMFKLCAGFSPNLGLISPRGSDKSRSSPSLVLGCDLV